MIFIMHTFPLKLGMQACLFHLAILVVDEFSCTTVIQYFPLRVPSRAGTQPLPPMLVAGQCEEGEDPAADSDYILESVLGSRRTAKE